MSAPRARPARKAEGIGAGAVFIRLRPAPGPPVSFLNSFPAQPVFSRPARRLAFALTVALLAGRIPDLAAADPERPAPGVVMPRLVCAADPTQSYALYLPSDYTPDRPWPILYCFDPGARGQRPVEIFREAAERFGYIVAGSNNSHNGPWKIVEDAARAMVLDTHQRFRINPRRRYATGFSGGARAACVVAAAYRMTGVVACGAGSPEADLPAKVEFAYFGTAGRDDFNYAEVQDATRGWVGRKLPSRFVAFDGGHQWCPPAIGIEALTWLELQAIRAGVRTRDDAFIHTQFRARMQAAAGESEPGKAYLDYGVIAADFAGLIDTTEPAAKADALKKTKPVRRYLSAEKSLQRQDARWTERLQTAIGEACDPSLSRSTVIDGFASSGGGDAMSGRSFNGTRAFDAAGSSPADRFASLREVASDLAQESADNPAKRRALSRAFAWVNRGRTELESGRSESAMVFFEAATILNPDAPEPYFAWAQACALRHEKTLARDLLKKAVASGFNDRERIAQLERSLAP